MVYRLGTHHNFIVEMTLSRYHAIASEMWLESTYCEYFILKRNMLHYFTYSILSRHGCASKFHRFSMVNYEVTGYVDWQKKTNVML